MRALSCAPLARPRARTPLLARLGLALLLAGVAAPASAQTTVVNDPDGITGAALFGDGVLWWNFGNCGEILRLGSVRSRSTLFGSTNAIEQDCDLNPGGSNVVRDETHVYFVKGSQIVRKSVTASESDPFEVVENLADGFGAQLALFEDHLYWFRQSNTVYSLMRRPVDLSTAAVTVLARVGPRPEKLEVLRFGTAQDLAYLWIEGDGDLFTRRLSGPLTQDVLVTTGAADFALHTTTSFVIGQGAVRTSRLYVAHGVPFPGSSSPPGSVTVHDLSTLSAATMYTSAGDNQVLAIATDSDTLSFNGFANLYIMEGAVSCGGIFCSVTDTFARRRRIVGTGSTAFQLILATGGGGSLESDDQYIYWVNDDRVRRLASDAPAIEIDWEAVGVEVVQNVQNLTQETRMVTGKRTFARGYARTKVNTSGAQIPVSAYLRGFRNNVELPGSPLQSFGAVVLPTNSDLDALRDDPAKSLLWELPDSWTAPGELTVRLEVDGTQATPETGPTADNAVNSLAVARFARRGRPCIEHRPIRIANTPNYYANSDPALMTMQRRATSLLPIEDFRNRFSSEPITEPELTVEVICEVCFPFYCCAPVPIVEEGPFEFDGKNDDDGEALFFTSLWSEFSNDPDECESDIHYLGAVHPNLPGCVDNSSNTSCFNGVAYRDSDDLLVRMEPTANGLMSFDAPRGGRTLAHELGHNYGRKHIDCGGPDGPLDSPPFADCAFGTDVANSVSTHYGFDPVTQTVIKPEDAGELMSYSGDRWISDHNWDAIWNETSTQGGLFAFGAGGNAVGPHVYVYGRVDDVGGTGELLPAYVLPDGSYDPVKVMRSIDAAAAVDASSPWTLEVRDAGGAVLFDTMTLVFESSDGPQDSAGFAQYLEFPAGATSVHLLFQGTSVASVTASSAAPQIALDPLVLDPVEEQLRVSWTASDADGDSLRFTIHYSADDGASWKLLRLDYGALSATLDTSLLEGSTSARVRVLASDGLNTTEALSPPFNLPTHDPVLVIGGVMDGEELPFGSDLTLLGMGVDAEDGSLPGSALDWSVTGPPDFGGSGSQLGLPDLIPGAYAVQLDGTDSDGQSGQASLGFSVAPVLVPDTATPSLDGYCGDGGYAAAVPLRLPLGSGHVGVRMVHAGSDLWICATDLDLPSFPLFASSFGVRVEVDGDGDAIPQAGDRGFLVQHDGDPFQEVVLRAGGFTTPSSPSPGYAVRVKQGAQAWSAEMRIHEDLVGGWGGTVRMGFRHGSSLWPPAHDIASPASWGDVELGDTAPPLANLAPVAVVGPTQAVDLVDATEVHLDGSGSYDADGDPLAFSWTQIAGPPVALVDADTATPEFALLADAPGGIYRFELVVDDGSLPSAPAVQAVTVSPATPAPTRMAPMPQLPPFVGVGDPGNAGHPDFGFGAVASAYRVRPTEVTNAEYAMFLQAVAQSDPFDLWDPAMGSDPRGGITRTGVDGAFVYEVRPLMMFKPVNFVGWEDAARYVNWLHNGSPTAPSGPGVTEDGAYDLGAGSHAREPGARFFLPTEDEWFKAAFQDPGFPGGWRPFAVAGSGPPTAASTDGSGNVSNPAPDVANYAGVVSWNTVDGHFVTTGTTLAPSFWGTYEQSGNVSEWTETPGLRGRRYMVRGGSYAGDADDVSSEGRVERRETDSRADLGFRVFASDAGPLPDADGDGVPDVSDNCTNVPNPGQEDANSGEDDNLAVAGVQHYGNACDPDLDEDGTVTPSDFFAGLRPCLGVDPHTTPSCAEADFDGDGVVGASDFFGTFRPAIGGPPGPGLE